MKFIDAHMHLQPWWQLKPFAREKMASGRDAESILALMKDPKRLAPFLDAEGCERVVSINYEAPEVMGFTHEANDFVLDYAKRAGGRVIPFCSLDPKKRRDPLKKLAAYRRRGMRGFKVHPSHQEVYPNAYRRGLKAQAKIYRWCEREGVPVMFHTGTSVFPGARNVYADPIHVDDVAVDFPDMTIVLAHGGRPMWSETCFFLMRRFPKMLLDISSMPPKAVLKLFPRLEEIAGRTLFGSDWPGPAVPGIRANAEAFNALPLSEAARARILYGNAAALFA